MFQGNGWPIEATCGAVGMVISVSSAESLLLYIRVCPQSHVVEQLSLICIDPARQAFLSASTFNRTGSRLAASTTGHSCKQTE